MSLYKGTTPVAGLAKNTIVNGFHIFDFKWSDKIINDISWLRSSTFSWQSGLVYTTAYNHLVTDISGITAETETIGSYTVTFYRATDGHKICLADQETTVSNIFSATGIAWYYILDTTNTQFKLPRTKWGFEGLRDTVGNKIDESLPNITGSINNAYFKGTTSLSFSGAFADTSSASTSYAGSASASGLQATLIDLKASNSSSTYQDGAPVQERATQMYLYFYVGEYTQSAIEQTAGLNSELFNGKVDLDMSNSTKPYLKTTYVNGTSGYNIWSNGYCEQWGQITSSGSFSVTFVKVFSNITAISKTIQSTYSNYYGTRSLGGVVNSVSTTGFSGYRDSADSGSTYWQASGYLASGQY